jgi:hypothetical protein
VKLRSLRFTCISRITLFVSHSQVIISYRDPAAYMLSTRPESNMISRYICTRFRSRISCRAQASRPSKRHHKHQLVGQVILTSSWTDFV